MPVNIHRTWPAQLRLACAAGGLLAGALALCGCGSGSGAPSAPAARSTAVPAYVTEPFTPEQHLIEQGAPLVVSDGCAACHLIASAHRVAPSFSSFAGHRVRLTSGRTVLVDERFVR